MAGDRVHAGPVLDKMYVDIVDTLGNVVFDHKCSK